MFTKITFFKFFLGSFIFYPFIYAMDLARIDLKMTLERLMEQAPPGSEQITAAISDVIKNDSVKDAFGSVQFTPLHLAALKGTVADIRVLLAKQAKVMAQDVQGSTVLHIAIQSIYRPDIPDFKEVIKQLLEGHEEDLLRSIDKRGNTPLHLVRFKKRYPSIMEDPALISLYNEIDAILVQKGADEDAVNMHGQTPRSITAGLIEGSQPIQLHPIILRSTMPGRKIKDL